MNFHFTTVSSEQRRVPTPLPSSVLVALILCSTGTVSLATAPSYVVEPATASVSGDTLKASVAGSAPMECAKLATVFVDFDAMASFLPGVESSAIASHGPGWAVIRQRTTLRFGLFSKTVDSERRIDMALPQRVDSASTGRADEPKMSSSTVFSSQGPSACRVAYSTQVEIPSWAPASVAASGAKSNASAQMTAMLAEARKRFGAMASPSPGPSSEEPSDATR